MPLGFLNSWKCANFQKFSRNLGERKRERESKNGGMKKRKDRIGDSNCENLVGVLLLTKLEKYIATATTSAAIPVRSGECSNR